jgi:pantoate kinase
MKSVKAFSPGNITCFFAIVSHKDPLKKGSLGVSFAIDKGALVEVMRGKKRSIIINGKERAFPTVETAINMLTRENLKIKIKTQVPIGCGYGMSGACTLAAMYAVNALLKLNKSKSELALIAHKAEVMNNTGLGSVTAEFLGGLLMRDKKSSPLYAKKLSVDRKKLYYQTFGPIDTKKIITSKNMKKKINMQGLKLLQKVKKSVSLDKLVSMSREFATNTGLLKDKKVLKIIAEIEHRGGHASMNMLGKSVFSTLPFKGSKMTRINYKGAYIIR